MIIGSGLLARAFTPFYAQRNDVCIYAAGVSNSSCTDAHEFLRERERLNDALSQFSGIGTFVYFGTCSVADPEAQCTPYVQHKLAMEMLVRSHPRHLILRLPQVAGRTPNPHTLLNHLYARISRSESFILWQHARRNIIDISDIVAVAHHLIDMPDTHNLTLNIANETSYPLPEIVAALERVTGKHAIFDTVQRGSGYAIDIEAIRPVLNAAGVEFGPDYLDRVLEKYYGQHD
jgi:nucleoside-diphosphate-sugar epimerase